jgi:hypothetical protein
MVEQLCVMSAGPESFYKASGLPVRTIVDALVKGEDPDLHRRG